MRRLRDSGLRITESRRGVIEVLAGSVQHLGSAEIVDRVQEQYPGVGRASVFRSLEAFTRLGIARPTYSGARGPTYYLVSASGHHAHVVCTRCGQVTEIPECTCDPSLVGIYRKYGVNTTSHLLEIYGLCARCADEVSGPGAGR